MNAISKHGLIGLLTLCLSWMSPASAYTITLHPGTHGSIAVANSGTDFVTTVEDGAAFPTVTVSPVPGCTFTGWTPAAPVTVTGDFEATAEYAGFACTTSNGEITITGYIGTPPAALTIPEMIDGVPVTGIGERAFCYNGSLTSVVVPDCVTSIGYSAFDQCPNLTSLTFGSGAVTTGWDCGNLTSITVSAQNPNYSSVDGVLFNKSQTRLVAYPGGRYGVYSIPGSVTEITPYAFSLSYKLTGVIIPTSVTSIGEGAFRACYGLICVTIPGSVTRIGSYAFGSCLNLIRADFMGNAPAIGGAIFEAAPADFKVHYYNGSTGFTSPTWNGSPAQEMSQIPPVILAYPTNQTLLSGATAKFSAAATVGNPAVQWQVSTTGTTGTFVNIDSATNPSAITGTLILTSVPTEMNEYAYRAVFTNLGGTTTTNAVTLTVTSLFTFGTNNGQITITGYTNSPYISPVDLSIPRTLYGLPVTGIGASAFSGCIYLTSVTLPESITSIGASAFSGCDNLTSMTIPSGVTSIGASMFSRCYSLTNLTLHENITSIGDSAFAGCSKLPSVTIPASVTIIGSNAFDSCTGLTSVTIPTSVATIGSNAFRSCTGLTNVPIPNSVTFIGSYAFYYCSGLTSVTLPESLTSMGDYAFARCSKLPSVTIPASVTTFGNYAFYSCTGLTSVTISSGVTTIGSYAFDSCTSLTSVTIPNSVTSIGSYAFKSCTGLTSVTIPSGVTSIGASAFSGCSNLTSVTLPESLTSIGDSALLGCSKLTSVTIPASVITFGSYAFQSCTGLTSVTISSGVTSIGSNAFYSCTGLTSVTIPNSVTSVGSNAFARCTNITALIVDERNCAYSGSTDGILFDKNQTTLVQYLCGKVGSYTIPASVTSIGSYAFSYCTGLTSVTIPSGVTTIGSNAFDSCTGLTSVTIPSGVTSIGASAFSGCSNLTSVTLPESISSIGDSALLGCSKLTSLTIPSGVTSIGASAFSGCSNLPSVTLPESLTSIGDSAFLGCSKLPSVTIPASVTTIGSNAFKSCTGLTCVTISSGVTTIGSYAFSYCTGLTSVTIPRYVTSIGAFAFSSCTGLSNAVFMGNAPSIGNPIITRVFGSTASNFKVHYFIGATGFASPTWNGYASQGDVLPAPPTPPAIAIQPVNQSVQHGATATFMTAASGFPAPTVQWQVSATGSGGAFTNIDSTANSSAITGTLTLTNAALAQNGSAYRAVFTNSEGSCTTAAATLTVYSILTLHPGAHGSITGENSGTDYVVTATNGAGFPAVKVNPAAGYTFTGWNPAAPDTVTGDFEATAAYTANNYTVTFDAAGGSVTPGSNTATYDAAYGALPTPTRAGHSFRGWWTGASGSAAEVTAATVMNTAQNHILFAKWLINVHNLTVASAHGTPTPAVGTYSYNWGTELACSVTSPDTHGTMRYVCTGWTGTGAISATGGLANTGVFTLTENSSITWNWNTEYFLDTAVSGNGSLDVTAGWHAGGSTVAVKATASAGWRFDHWLLDGQPAGGTTNQLDVRMDVAHLATACFVVLDLAEALDNHDLAWTSGGDANWVPQIAVSHDGIDAACSGAINDKQTTWLETTVENSGTLSFWWKVSSEKAYDWLSIRIDNNQRTAISGETLWEYISLRVEGTGNHSLRWQYAKDKNDMAGTDCGWLDQVVWTPDVPPLAGFALWTNQHSLLGDTTALFRQDSNGDGVPNGVAYAFGSNLPADGPAHKIRVVNNRPVFEIPAQDAATLPYVGLRVLGSTDLINWSLPVIQIQGAAAGRVWYQLDGPPTNKAFFKLEAVLK